ncbi:ATPase [Enterovibrio norvegicus FF-33]|uniref:ATPase n=1 Tax=Enterovibrio norvegicus FF-454 TaxID=1185651 RepID=A0A1E5CG52_9GAMM|nr:ATPase [Enterovibrio norvegicus]OEE64112.1 ATPase [Enterovibrio norvegicus FF-454]OEE67030.1 ATPase [Enterovibrio norvegicus FF-33]OEE82407.1 ATPase [Enterovibrio norvegicus FF-162]
MIDLENMMKGAPEREPDLPLPSLEDQKRIVAELKALEEKGELTPEVMEKYFGGKSTH